MNPSENPSGFGADLRLDALLASQPVAPTPDFTARTLERVRAEVAAVAALRAGDDAALERFLIARPIVPANDFVFRTLARIRSESNLLVAARAGQADALDELLDRWLSDQPVQSEHEPVELVAGALRKGDLLEQEEALPAVPVPHRVLVFPAWARGAASLAAAAAVAFVAYFNVQSASVSQPAPKHLQLAHRIPLPQVSGSAVATDEPAVSPYDPENPPDYSDAPSDGGNGQLAQNVGDPYAASDAILPEADSVSDDLDALDRSKDTLPMVFDSTQ